MRLSPQRVAIYFMAIALGGFLLVAAAIAAIGLNDRIVDTDLAIVPGNTVNTDGSPSPRLAGRLEAALSLYQAGHCKAILVSGGIDPNGFDEAKVMAAYLMKQGVPATAIYNDNHGVNTFATARFAASLIREKHFRQPLLVSQYFHIARFKLAMAKQGMGTSGHAHARYFEARDAYSLAREVFGLVGYAFKARKVPE